MRRLLNSLFKLAISVGLVVYLLRNLDMAALGVVFASVIPWLVVTAILFFVLSNILGAIQWYFLLRAQSVAVSFRQALIFYQVGVFFNNVLLGNIGGDALRIYDIRRLTGESSGGIGATVMDRFIGLFSTCTLALIAYPLIAGLEWGWAVSVLVPVWCGLVAVLAVGLSRRLGALFDATVLRFFPTRLRGLLNHLRHTLGVYRNKVALLGGIWVVSMGVQFCRILVYYAAGLAIGIDVGLVYFVCFQPVAAILAALPISMGGLGVRENVLVTLFATLAVEGEVSTAMSLLGYMAGIIASLIGGITFVLRRVERVDSD